VETIPDDEDDIVQTIRRVSPVFDFVITSGGIGNVGCV
jgi:molybdopterin-biosynthesis enzyme MoeA-like protein